ncbi:MAG: MarR family transcriptional regulator [Alphaproteobacteria bacterium]|nr:MarR family transcriptional regulator [Alphaproteobacteria bacterium]
MTPIEHCPVFGFYKASRTLIKIYSAKLQSLNLTYPQYLVISVLEGSEPHTVDAIGNKLNLDSGTITPLLKRLESQGLLTRKHSPEDERKKCIALTEQGHAILPALGEIRQSIKKMFGLSTEELTQLRHLLKRINEVQNI